MEERKQTGQVAQNTAKITKNAVRCLSAWQPAWQGETGRRKGGKKVKMSAGGRRYSLQGRYCFFFVFFLPTRRT